MGMQAAKEAAPVVERGCAPLYFVSGLVRIDHLNSGNMMFTFWRQDNGRREIEVKIVCSRADCETMRRQTDMAMAGFTIAEDEVSLALM